MALNQERDETTAGRAALTVFIITSPVAALAVIAVAVIIHYTFSTVFMSACIRLAV